MMDQFPSSHPDRLQITDELEDSLSLLLLMLSSFQSLSSFNLIINLLKETKKTMNKKMK
jgi:hypothetical protein